MSVTLSHTLIALDVATSLLFVPALTKKGRSVLFVLGKVLIIDLTDGCSVIEDDGQASGGLLYNSENHKSVPVNSSDQEKNVRAMMAFAQDTVSADTSDASGLESVTEVTSGDGTERNAYESGETQSDLSENDGES